MNTTIQENRTRSTTHPISAEDKAAMVAMRAIAEPNKGRLQGTAARVPFDAIGAGSRAGWRYLRSWNRGRRLWLVVPAGRS